MDLEYSEDVDAAYLKLIEEIGAGGVAMTYPCDPAAVNGQINLDFDNEGRLVGLEVLDASRLLRSETLAESHPIGSTAKPDRAGFGGQSLTVHVMGESELVGSKSSPAPAPVCGGPPLNKVLNRAFSKEAFIHLSNVDEYGTTIFNGMQLGEVLPELERLRAFADKDDERRVVEELIEIGQRVKGEGLTFLVFLGD